MNTVALPTSNTSEPPTTSRTSKSTRNFQSMITSTSLRNLFMTSTTTNRQTQGTWKNRLSTSNSSSLSWSIKFHLTNGKPSSTQKVLNSRRCPRNSSMPKLESTPLGSNLLNRSPMKSKLSRPNFNNLSNPSPLDLTISKTIAATAKDEEATKATLATMVETMAVAMVVVATILVAKARTTNQTGEVDIPTTRISPVNCMEGDTIPTNVSRSRNRLANSISSLHLA